MPEIREFDEAALKRISTRVRQTVTRKFGLRGELFFMNNIEVVTELLKATWIAIREELERQKQN